jgi:AmmeMemoRadiSam system protein A
MKREEQHSEYSGLFAIARQSIESGLKGGSYLKNAAAINDKLLEPSGAFVSLFICGDLRGCIGKLSSSDPLSDVIAEMSWAAAFRDPRFPPLTEAEYSDLTIEISVLTPLSKIESIDEIVIGKHGLYIIKSGRSGVLLPQVALSRGWSVVEFLQHTSSEKAGIGKDGWKEAEIFVFEAIILHES